MSQPSEVLQATLNHLAHFGLTMLMHCQTTHPGFLKRLKKERAGELDYVKGQVPYYRETISCQFI